MDALKNLGDAIEKAEASLEFLVARTEERQKELDRIEAELDGVEQQDSALAPPTREEVERRIGELVSLLQCMDRTVRDELECLVGRIRAVPYLQFGSNKVVLRAKFELRLWALLPAQTRVSLAGLYGEVIADDFGSIKMMVDLFEPSAGPKYGLRALELREKQGLTFVGIGEALGVSKRTACVAVQYGLALREAGLTDPFLELTEPPKAASRWRTHPRHQQSGSRPDDDPRT
jgi:hypothetical protein